MTFNEGNGKLIMNDKLHSSKTPQFFSPNIWKSLNFRKIKQNLIKKNQVSDLLQVVSS